MTDNQRSAADRQQTNLGLLGYLFIGTAVVLVPSVMPSITDEFAATGLTLAAIGLLFPAREVGSILGNLLSGIGSDQIGRRRLVWIAALLLAAALLFAVPFVATAAPFSSDCFAMMRVKFGKK